MKRLDVKQVKLYMHMVIEDHRDRLTGEINMTSLAEDASARFNMDDEIVYELAYEVATGAELS